MATSRPYHRWTRLHTSLAGTLPQGSGPALTPLISIAFATAGHTPDDLIERAFLDVNFSFLLHHAAGSGLISNDWIGGTFPLIAGAVVGQTHPSVPDPVDTLGPSTNITMTGSMLYASAGIGPLPHPTSDVDWFASWHGTFESQGTRLSPVPGDNPSYQVGFRLVDATGWSQQVYAITSDWYLDAYLRVLAASSTPF